MTGVEGKSKGEKYKVSKSLYFWDFESGVL